MKSRLLIGLAVLSLGLAALWFGTRRPAGTPAVSAGAPPPALEAAGPTTLSLAEAEDALSARQELTTPADERRRATPVAPTTAPDPAPSDALIVGARLIDEHGNPLAGARLAWVESTEAELYRERTSARSDRSGAVWLSIERSGVPRDLTLTLAAGAPARARVLVPLTPARWCDVAQCSLGELMLPVGGEVEGRVLDAGGGPFEGAYVGVTLVREQPTEAERARMRVWDGPERLGPSGVRPYALSGPDGRYHIEGVPIGRFALVASVGRGRANEVRLPARSAPIEVLPGAPLLAPDLVLEPALDEDKIAGTVLDPAGVPVAGVEVSLLDDDLLVAQGRSGAGGRFALLAMQDRGYLLRASTGPWDTGEQAALPVQAGTLDVVLRLEAVTEKPK